MHTHVGSGSDPVVWRRCATLALAIVAQLPDVTTLSLGGGFKVARMPHEKAADMGEIGLAVREDLLAFARDTGRQLHLEVEPGTFLVANAGALVCRVGDVVATDAYHFVKLDAGMTDIMRPTLYGAQHPMRLVPQSSRPAAPTVSAGGAAHPICFTHTSPRSTT